MTDDPDFIRRWSRRKRAARREEKPADARPVDEPEVDPDSDEMSAATGLDDDHDSSKDDPDVDPETLDLPDIDSLSKDSDFKPFLRKGVPAELRNRAMRKLWRVNPTFRHLDGLNDYDGDFTDAATVVKGLKTLYKVGRGFMPEPKPATAPDDPKAEEPPEAATTDATNEPVDGLEEPDPDPETEVAPEGNKIT